MLRRWFLSHPRSVGETYFEHLQVASRFGLSMLAAGIACAIHAFIPALLDRAASDAVGRLHSRMKDRSPSSATPTPASTSHSRAVLDGGIFVPYGGGTAGAFVSAPAFPVAALALVPGIALAFAGAAFAMAIARETVLPATFAALLLGFGISLFSVARKPLEPGFTFSGRVLLRLGVVLLGAKIDATILYGIGFPAGLVTILAMVMTIGVGTAVGRMFGFGREFSLLSSCAVAICGASAALAIAAVLPNSDESNGGETAYVIGVVTLLGSAAMLLLPVVAHLADYSPHFTAILLGGTIHELAQVAGAGFGLSDAIGNEAVAVKLLRVACLAPIAAVIGLRMRGQSSVSPPVVPAFLIGFLVLAGTTTVGLMPEHWKAACASISSLCLLAALVAIGAKLSLANIATRGPAPALLIAGQSVLLIATLMIGLHFIGDHTIATASSPMAGQARAMPHAGEPLK